MRYTGSALNRHRLQILAAAFLWSTSGAAVKRCDLTGWQISLGRSAIAAVVLFALLPDARVRPSRAIAGVAVTYAITVVLYMLATKLTTAANAIFLQDTAPLYVMALSTWVLGERPTRSELRSAPIFLVGLALFFIDRLAPGQLTGNVLALGSGVAFGACIVGLRRLGKGRNASAIAWGNVLAAVASMPGAFAVHAHGVVRPIDLVLVAFLGVFQLGLAYALFARGIEGVHATEASLLALLEPVLNPVWTFLLAGERPGRWALCGGAVVLTATLWRVVRG